MVVGVMRLQPACQQLKPPMHAVDAMSVWRIHACFHSLCLVASITGVRARDKCCQARPIELLGCSAHVVVGMMRLQPACQQLKPPVHAVHAVGALRIHAHMLPSCLVGSNRCAERI